MSLIDLIADERLRVADFAETLSPEDLETQSLCAEWSVRDVLAHLLMPMVTSTPTFVLAMAKRRFDFDRVNVDLTARVASRTPAELIAGLREKPRHPFKPPGFGHEAPLTDLLIHTQDMARPLGREVDPPVSSVAIALDFLGEAKAARSFGAPSTGDLRLVATDADWSRGEGPEVTGRALDLLLVLSGRSVALERLDGAGLGTLTERLA